MEAQWFKSIRANGCYDLDVLTAMPVKDDIIAHRHHDGRTTFALVCGSRPSTQHIIIKRWNTTYNEWQVGAKEYLSYTTANQYGFGCYFTHKVVPKRNNDNAQAPVVAQAPQVVERIVERVVYRDRPVAQAPTTAVPTHIKNEIVEFINFGKEYECPICMDTIAPNNLHITKCGHFYCEACINGVQADYRGTRHCPTCRADL